MVGSARRHALRHGAGPWCPQFIDDAGQRILRRRFPDDMVLAWVKHNVEEVGQLEYLLPQLSGEAEPAQRA